MNSRCRASTRRRLNACVVFYTCISLLGCTPAVVRHANGYATREPKHWAIEQVYFAALQSQHRLRLCLLLDSPSGETRAQLYLNLKAIAASVDDPDSLAATISASWTDSTKGCKAELKDGELPVPVVVRYSDKPDLTAAIRETTAETPAQLTVYFVHYQADQHPPRQFLMLGAPSDQYPELASLAYHCYEEDQKTYVHYLWLPLALFGDMILVMVAIVGTIYVAIIFIPLLILSLPFVIAQSVTGSGDQRTTSRSSSSGGLADFLFSGPPLTVNAPECT